MRKKPETASIFVPEAEQPYKIPYNWRWVRLSALVSPSKQTIADFSADIKYVGLEHMETGRGIVSCESAESLKSVKNVFHDGQILYGKLRPYLNKHDIANFSGVCSTDILVFEKNACSCAKYVNYYFDLPYFFEYAVSHSRGIHLPRVTESILLNAACPLPPLAEQQRIVDRIESLFSKLDAARDNAQAVLDGFELRKAAILYRAFSGELTEKWRNTRHIDLKGWKIKKLSETSITIIDGDRGKNYPNKDDFSSSGYCIFLSAKNVTKNGFVFDKCEYITKEKDESLRSGRLERGDMIMTTRGTIGNVAIYDDSVPYNHLRINSGMVIYRGGVEFIKPYLIWLYQSKLIENQIHALQTGSAQPQLPIKVMKALVLPIPTIPEQEAIVSKLDSLILKEQQVAETAECIVTEIDAMKKAILGRAFRGELGTNDPSEESPEAMLRDLL